MKVLSINVGKPIAVEFDGKLVSTGIFKSPIAGQVSVGKYNLAGDGQADLTVHGGEDKAVYAYPFEHYEYWRHELDRDDMPYGLFGENLTVSGLSESESCIGDRWKIGTALFAITQPRQPCFKLGIRFNDSAMPRRFAKSELTGVYLKVLHEGFVEAGDSIELVERGYGGLPVRELFHAYMHPGESTSRSAFRKALEIADLSAAWRTSIAARVHL
jgi:MOSC domain-containing protein YiiM